MANVTDFLQPRSMTEIEVIIRTTKKYAEWVKLRKICYKNLKSGDFSGDLASGKITQAEQDILDQEDCIVSDLWHEYRFLPAEMEHSVLCYYRFQNEVAYWVRESGYLVRYSMLPRTRLSYIRNVAERLSFVIIPYEYADLRSILAAFTEVDEAYAREVEDGFEDLESLCGVVGRYFEEIDTYMLCPVSFYDPWLEVQDEQLRQKVFGGELALPMVGLEMMMPAQKNLYQMCKINKEGIEELGFTMEENFKEVKRCLDDLQGRVSWLAEAMEHVAGQVADAVKEATDAKNTAEYAVRGGREASWTEIEKKYFLFGRPKSKIFCALDPLVFAVPKGTDIRKGDVDAHLLMCFGADMPVEFFSGLGLTQKENCGGYYDPIIKTCKLA